MEKFVSIVIPCYNDVRFVEQAIESAINQTYPKKEILLIDDGSNEETKRVLKKIEPKITKLITQKNLGQSSARNKGIKISKGEYILVLDSDDFFEKSFCEEAVNVFESSQSIKLVSCYANLISKESNIGIYRPSGGNLEKALLNNIALGSLMFKKADWEMTGGYDENMKNGFEDWEFYIRLLSRGGKAFIIKQPLFNYRQRLDSTTLKANKIKFELLRYIYIKHKNLYVNNYDLIINHLLNRAEREENEKIKKINSIEYKLGTLFLRPIRFLKRLFL